MSSRRRTLRGLSAENSHEVNNAALMSITAINVSFFDFSVNCVCLVKSLKLLEQCCFVN